MRPGIFADCRAYKVARRTARDPVAGSVDEQPVESSLICRLHEDGGLIGMLSIRITCYIEAKDPGAERKALRTGEIQVRSICNVQRIRRMSAMERPRTVDKSTSDAMVFVRGLWLGRSMAVSCHIRGGQGCRVRDTLVERPVGDEPLLFKLGKGRSGSRLTARRMAS